MSIDRTIVKNAMKSILLTILVLLLLSGCTTLQPIEAPVPEDGETTQSATSSLFIEGEPNANGSFETLYRLNDDVTYDSEASLAVDINAPELAYEEGEEVTLRIFHFNDLHNHLFTPHRTRGDTHTFSQMVKIVNDAKNDAGENEIVLFLSAGDDHIGTIFDELLGFDAETFTASAAYQAYSAAGVDASVIGNHELDRGTELLSLAIAQDADFPVLSANIDGSEFLTDDLVPAAILGVADGLRVGIIGLTTPNETRLHTEAEPDLGAADLIETLEQVLPPIADNADVVILLTHVGYHGEESGVAYQNAGTDDVALAEMAAEMTDVPIIVVGGHTNVALNEDGAVVSDLAEMPLILQASHNGQHLGEAEVNLALNESGWDSEATAQLHTLKRRDDRVTPDDERYPTLEHDEDYDQAFDDAVIQPLFAMLADRMDDVIGEAGAENDYTTEMTFADRYVGESAIANFMNDAIVTRSSSFPPGPDGEEQQIDIAVFNATGLAGGVDPGIEITFNDWYGVMPYADTLILLELTGAEIGAILNSNAQRLVRAQELAENGGTLNPADFISRGFLHFSEGVRYKIDPGDEPAEAIATEITLFGEPIEEVLDRRYTVAINSYLAAGRGGWNGEPIGAGLSENVPTFDLLAYDAHDTGLIYRNEIVNFIREVGEVSEETGAAKDGRVQIID